MSYRFMRVIVFFDLPVVQASERKEYTRFRKFLIKSGFIMMQESVYTKILLNHNAVKAITENVKKNKPPKGLVQLLVITENQYNKMEIIVGELNTTVLNTDERLVEI